MNPANKSFLEANRTHWITLRDAFYIRHLDGNTRSEMQRIMGEEFRPGYTSDLWCGVCVADMVTALYQEFEKWEAANPVITFEENPTPIPEGHAVVMEFKEDGEVVKTIEPFDAPIPVKANFPSHKNRRR